MPADALRTIVEYYFSDEFLFQPGNTLLRKFIAPPIDGDCGDRVPPLFPIANLLHHSDVKSALASAPPGKEVEWIVASVESSSLVKAEKSPRTGQWCLRRLDFLDDRKDPALRTVYVRPIHPSSNDTAITDYFSKFGRVEKVIRETTFGVGLSAVEAERAKAFAHVVFSSIAEAEGCAKALHTLGNCSNPLGQPFIPTMTVRMLQDHDDRVAEQTAEATQRQLQTNITEAQKAILAKRAADATAPQKKLEELFSVKKFLRPNQTLKCTSVPTGVTWEQIKAKLGNLCLARPGLKKAISLVKIVEPAAEGIPSTRTAFIVLNSTSAREELFNAFALASGEWFDGILQVCPNLSNLSAEEDSWVRGQYAEWTEKKVETKLSLNAKRARDELT